MSKKVFQVIAIVLLTFSVASAQSPTIIIEIPLTGEQSIVARDEIVFKQGFVYNPTLKTMLEAKIDESLILNASYLETPVNPDDRPIDTSLPVGAIAGAPGVSPSGGATYSIPIQIPQGIAGMQPAISINYNSQGGDGILGIGWNIAGLSVITRVPRTIYSDGAAGGINFRSDNDKFALDGNRLLALSGAYGDINTTYETEAKTFSKIESFGIINDNLPWPLKTGPEWFKVTTKDGKIIEYGNTSDSRFVPGSNSSIKAPLVWMINKVTDLNGNFMSFTYRKQNNQVVIEKIEYTANGSNKPINTIYFYYEEKGESIRSYISGRPVDNSLLLRKIKADVDGITVRSYAFKYFTEKGKTFLNTVDEKLADGNSLNSTVVSWGDNNIPVTVTYLNIPTSFLDFEYYVSYDYDDDGLTDIIAIKRGNNSSDVVQVFKANNNSGTLSFEPFGEPFGYCCDSYGAFSHMNVRLNLSVLKLRDKSGFPWYGNNAILWPSYRTSSGVTKLEFKWVIDDIKLESQISSLDQFPVYTVADFNNDGVDEIIYFERVKKNGVFPGNIIDVDFFVHNQPPAVSLTNINNKPERLFVLDFNSDGLLDLIAVNGDGYFLYRNKTNFDSNTNMSKTEFIYVFSSNQFNSSSSVIETGDFNGDGLVDFIFNEYCSTTWYLAINKGNSTFDKILLPNVTSQEEEFTEYNDDKDQCVLLDFNKDGKTDVVIIDAVYERKSNWIGQVWGKFVRFDIKWYVSTGTGFELYYSSVRYDESFSLKKYVFAGDFNGNGNIELFNYGKSLLLNPHDPYINVINYRTYGIDNSDFNAGLVANIKNGFGNEIKFEYQPLTYTQSPTGNTFYAKGSNLTYPLRSIQAPLYCVRSLTVPNGVGGQSTTEYSYEAAKVHLTGKGFLGFYKQFTENSLFDRRNVITNVLSSDFFPSKQTALVETIDGTSLSESETFYNNTPAGNSTFSYVFKSVNKDLLNGNSTTTTYEYDDDYGNLLKKSSDFGGGHSSEVTYTGYVNAGSWIPNAPQYITKETKHNDDGTSFSTATRYGYNATTGNVELAVSNYGKAGKEVTTNYSNFNAWGQPRSVQTSAASEGGAVNTNNTIEFDANGRYTKSVTDNFGTTQYEVDPVSLNVISETSPNGLITRYKYDSQSRVVQVTPPNGNVVNTQYLWGSTTNPTKPLYASYTSSNGSPWVKKHYDILGREVKVESIGFNSSPVISETKYSADGTVYESVTTLGGAIVSKANYDYDDVGRIENEVYNTGKSISYSYPANSVEQTINGKKYTKTFDKFGSVKTVSEPTPGGNIYYNYASNGQVKEIKYPTATVDIDFDELGQQKSLDDPSSGASSYRYDAVGRLTHQKDAELNESNYFFDSQNRIENVRDKNGDVEISYEYYTESGVNKGKLKKVTSDTGAWESYEYDEQLGRLTTVTKHIDESIENIVFQYQYDNYGNISQILYPGNTFVAQQYDNIGNLVNVATGGATIWNLDAQSASNLKYTLGNGHITNKNYDSNGMLSSIVTSNGTVFAQSAHYTFDAVNGLLTSREDRRSDTILMEEFDYDDINRLTNWDVKVNGVITNSSSIQFDADTVGNITFKTGVGNYTYKGDGPHSIRILTTEQNGYLPPEQDVYYTEFGKVERIEENGYVLDITYGADKQRVKSVLKLNGAEVVTTYFAGPYEVKKYPNGVTKEYLYIFAGDGTAAVIVKTSGGSSEIYYLHKDHLGSIVAITNQSGQIVEQANYDPWGRLRNPSTWSFDNVVTPTILTRGFTGHEHLHEFALINMNGRVYDPVLGLFLSPDPYVQAPDFSQNFNRYSYAFNNPLKYTDPDGNIAIVDDVILGLIGGTINVLSNIGSIQNLGQGFAYFGVGFVGGVLSEYITPVGAAALVGGGNAALGSYINTGHVDPGAVIQGATTSLVVSGLTMGIGKALGPITDKALKGIASPVLRGAITQGVVGTSLGAVGGGVGSVMNGGDFWDGAGPGALWGGGIGFASGAYGGYLFAKSRDLNPWTGRPNVTLTPLKLIPATSVSSSLKPEWEMGPSPRGFAIEKITMDEYYTDWTHTPRKPTIDGYNGNNVVSIKSNMSGDIQITNSLRRLSEIPSTFNKTLHVVTPPGYTPSNWSTIQNFCGQNNITLILTHH